jgi:DNA-binding response OmpR family regulator
MRMFVEQAAARRQPSARARTLRAAGIELDPMRRTVTRDGRQLDLSVKEFGVLEALLVASPAFLCAEDLLEQVCARSGLMRHPRAHLPRLLGHIEWRRPAR